MKIEDFLRKAGIYEILKFFHEHPEGAMKSTPTDQKKEGGNKINPRSGFQAFDILDALGSFEPIISSGKKKQILYKLSEKGKHLMSCFQLIEELISDTTIYEHNLDLQEFLKWEIEKHETIELKKD